MIINEIFYSLQGEGANWGKAAIFIRLTGCNLRCHFCDTEFDTGSKMSDEDILNAISQYPGKFIIWTGGEPTLQLRLQTVMFFKEKGYYQAIETNGTQAVPEGIDYITCSPKPEAIQLLHDNFPNGVNEFRYPIHSKGSLPPPVTELPHADNYLVSPVFIGREAIELDKDALERCVEFVKANPEWRLSIQMHKILGFR